MHPMQPIGINHVTAPNLSVDVLFDLAENLGAAGVELRDDLGRDIFDRRSPQDLGQDAQRRRLKFLAIAPDIQTPVDPTAVLVGSMDHIAHGLAGHTDRVRTTATL